MSRCTGFGDCACDDCWPDDTPASSPDPDPDPDPEPSDRPGWARTCTCGDTPDGFFCVLCMAWAGTTYGDQASWSRPRVTTVEPMPTETAEALDKAKPEHPEDSVFRGGRLER